MSAITEKMLVLQTKEKSINYEWESEYEKTNMTDIKIIPCDAIPEGLSFSNGQNFVEPKIGISYMKNPFKQNEYIEISSGLMHNIEDSRLKLYFELAHLLGASKIEYSTESDFQESATKHAKLDVVQHYIKQMCLNKESFSFTKIYSDKTCYGEKYGDKDFEKAKKLIRDNCLEHAGDFAELLRDRDPSTHPLQKSEYDYSFRESASSIMNLSCNFERLAKALKMPTPLSNLICSPIEVEIAREIVQVKRIKITMEFYV